MNSETSNVAYSHKYLPQLSRVGVVLRTLQTHDTHEALYEQARALIDRFYCEDFVGEDDRPPEPAVEVKDLGADDPRAKFASQAPLPTKMDSGEDAFVSTSKPFVSVLEHPAHCTVSSSFGSGEFPEKNEQRDSLDLARHMSTENKILFAKKETGNGKENCKLKSLGEEKISPCGCHCDFLDAFFFRTSTFFLPFETVFFLWMKRFSANCFGALGSSDSR